MLWLCFSLLFLVLICVIVLLYAKKDSIRNYFTNLTVEQRWSKRKKSLKGIDVKKYEHYYQPIQKRDFSNNTLQPGLIMVSVASYRDNQCIPTVQNLAESANHPENLRIVVCQQNDDSVDMDCYSWCIEEGNKNHPACQGLVTNITRMGHGEARGPSWARFLIQQQWTGEEYFMQIDAHTRLIDGWDDLLIGQLERCPSDKPCLTQYPSDYKIVKESEYNDKKKEKWETHKLRGPLLIDSVDETDGFTRVQSDYTNTKYKDPIPSKGWGACFSFSKGSFIEEAGYDPYTPFLFFGEEMDIGIRAWTRGWDFYSPYISCVFTSFDRDHRPTFWEHPDQRDVEVLSRYRIYDRLGYLKNLSGIPPMILVETEDYGLGNVRTIEDYEKFAEFSRKLEAKT